MRINVAVFFGGKSVEHEVSIISGLQAFNALNKDKYNAIPIYITKEGLMYTGETIKHVKNYSDMKKLLASATRINIVNDGVAKVIVKYPSPFFKPIVGEIDVAIPVTHGSNGEDGTLQGFLELLGIPYVGCGVLGSAVGMDKVMMKLLLKQHGIPVLDCVYFYSREWYSNKQEYMNNAEKLGWPLIVKPANLGSSVGVKKANNPQELEDAVDLAASFTDRIMVEHAITALREINCSVLGNPIEARPSVCEEPISGDEILSYQDKYIQNGGGKGMSGATRKIPADIPNDIKEKIQKYSVDSFKTLCCSGVSRIDCMIDKDNGNIYVNEINTIPGSLSFYLWEATGLSFEGLMDELVNIAFARKREREAVMTSFDTNLLQMHGGAKGVKGTK